MDALSYFALLVLVLVVLILAYGIIAIHDIPYLVAKARNHPHQDAIHYGGWVSLFTLHAIWPFLWIWATAYHPEGGYAGRPSEKKLGEDKASAAAAAQQAETAARAHQALEEKIDALEQKISRLESAPGKTAPASPE